MSLSFVIGLLLSVLIGLSLGMIGGGGSIITVPVLVYVLGVEAHQAISMSLAVVGATSIIGTSLHHQHKTVIWKIGFLFGGAGIFGAYFGSRLTYLFSPSALLLIFAVIMIVVAIVMFTNTAANESAIALKPSSKHAEISVPGKKRISFLSEWDLPVGQPAFLTSFPAVRSSVVPSAGH